MRDPNHSLNRSGGWARNLKSTSLTAARSATGSIVHDMMIYSAIAVTIVVDVFALAIIGRKRMQLAESQRLRRWRRRLWVLGGVLALSAVTIMWPYDAETKILGFPFPGAVFELRTTSRGETFWADFTGPLSLPFLALDFALMLYAPQSVLAVLLLTGGDTKAGGQPPNAFS